VGTLAQTVEYPCPCNDFLIPHVIPLVRKRDLAPPGVEHRATPLLYLVRQQRCARTLDHHCHSKGPFPAQCTALCTPLCPALSTNSPVKGHLITKGPFPTRCIALRTPHAPNSSMHNMIHQVYDWHCGIPFRRKDTCLPLLSPLFAQGHFPHLVYSTVDTWVRALVCRTGVKLCDFSAQCRSWIHVDHCPAPCDLYLKGKQEAYVRNNDNRVHYLHCDYPSEKKSHGI